jgi:hypothetical protein
MDQQRQSRNRLMWRNAARSATAVLAVMAGLFSATRPVGAQEKPEEAGADAS